MVLFAIGVRRGPRGFASISKNINVYRGDRIQSQNPDLRFSLLLSVSSDELSVEELSDVERTIDELSVDELSVEEL